MAADLGTLKARIARELHRSDLTTDIVDAINSAIRYYRSRSFEFLDKTATFTTTAGVSSYSSIADIGSILTISAVVSGRDYVLEALNYPRFQELQTSPYLSGQPTGWATYGGSIYVWPTPSGAFPLTVTYQQRVAAPVDDTDVSVWTDDAEPLIRARAKYLLCLDVMMDGDTAQACAIAEAEALKMLMNEAWQTQDVGRLEGHW